MSVTEAPIDPVGKSLRRKEDPRLITGSARYMDDISLPGTLWVAFVRSPEAHAKIVSINTEEAASRPGIQAVFTGPDLADLTGPLPMAWVPPGITVNNPAALAAGRETLCATWVTPSPRSWATTATPWSTRPNWWRSSTSRCPW